MTDDHAFPLTFSCVGKWSLPPTRRVNRRIGMSQARRSLSLVTPTVNCLDQARTCAVVGCRHHLGAARPGPEGHLFRCALDVARSYPHGLPPVQVAALMGLPESDVQRAERAAFPRLRLEMQRQVNEEHALQARRRPAPTAPPAPPGRAARPAPGAPRLPLPASLPGLASTAPPLVLECSPSAPPPARRRRRRPHPQPSSPAAPVDPRQLAFPWGPAA